MREKIGIIIVGLLLLMGTIAVVPANANTAANSPAAVDRIMDITTMEDSVYYLNLTPIFGEDWASMDVSNTEHLDVEVVGNEATILLEPDWNGGESFLMTATYYSVNPPPDNTINSVSTYTVQINMYVRAVNDAPYLKQDAPSYYRVYGDGTTFANLYDVFGDIDTSSLTFEVSSSNPNVIPSLIDGNLQLTSMPGYYGISDLNLSASDGEYTISYQVDIFTTPDHNITLDEDNFMIAPLSDYMPDGWYKLDVVGTQGIDAYYDDNDGIIVVTTEENWNGEGTVELTGYYYSVSPPPGDETILSEGIKVVDIPTTAMPVNDPPYLKQGINSHINFNEDTKLTLNLYDYFGDVDNDVLQFSAVSSTPAVSVSTGADGTISLTPAHNWDGQFSLEITASDGEYSTEMPIVLNVAPAPDVYLNEDGQANIDLTQYFNAGWISMSAQTDNNISVTIDGNSAIFIPAANWNGEENITFWATYYNGLQPYSSQNTVQPDLPPYYHTTSKIADISVAPVNDAPFVKNSFPSYMEMSEDGVITANLYDYFGDVDNSELQFTATSTVGHVSFAIDQNGEMTVEPEANWSGYTDIIVSAFDGEFVTSAVATMAVSPSPDVITKEDTPAVINLTDYFEPGWISASISANRGHVDAMIDKGNGSVVLSPKLNWNGYTTLEISVTYPNYPIISGSGPLSAPGYITVSKLIEIVVEPVNDPPIQIAALPDLSTNEDTSITLDLNNYFSDVDSPLSFNITAGAGLSTAIDENTGILAITPLSNWNGDTNLSIAVSDGQYNIDVEKPLIVRPVNDAPIQLAALPEFQMDEDGVMTIDMNNYFSDVDSPLNFTAEPNGPFSVSVNESGFTTITPAANWNGQTSMNLTVSDGEFSIAEPVKLDIKAVNDAPVEVASLPTLEFNEDGIAFIDLNNYFEDIDSTLIFSVTAGEGLHASVSSVNHMLRVTSDRNWNGNSDIKITVTDGEFNIVSTEKINVLSVDDAPTVLKNPRMLKGMEDSIITLDLDDYFDDVDSPLTYSWNAPESLSLSMDPESHVVTITPKSNWYGNADIAFTATDGTYSATIQPRVSIKNVEDAPIALESGKVFKGMGNQIITVDLSTLFSDPDADPLTYTVTSADGTTIPFTVDQQRHTLSITVPKNAQGTFGLKVTASDGEKTASTDIYALVMPQSSGGTGGTEAGVSPAVSDEAVMALAIVSSAALIGMLTYHTYQYRKYGNKKKDAML